MSRKLSESTNIISYRFSHESIGELGCVRKILTRRVEGEEGQKKFSSFIKRHSAEFSKQAQEQIFE